MAVAEVEAGTRPAYRLGLATLDEEADVDSLPVEGSVPDWLAGTLVRNGPARFEIGERAVRHWFDGLAMLHRFSFDAGRISYRNRFLLSEAYRAAQRGDASFGSFATAPGRSLIGRARGLPGPPAPDNCSFGVAPLAEGCVAVSETPRPIAFSPETLEVLDIPYTAPGHHVAAHHQHDPQRGELLGCAVDFGRRPAYRLFAQRGRESQRIVAELPIAEPSYVHSFALTERHLVLTLCPFVVDPLQLGLSRRPFIKNFRWEAERPTVFVVLDRETGEVRARLETPSFFAFHHVNAFERGPEIVIDAIAYAGPEVIDALYLERLRSSPPPDEAHGRLTRYRLRPARGTVVEEEICGEAIELPQIDQESRNGRPYRYAYGVGAAGGPGEPADFLDRILKVDVESGDVASWHEPATYPGEPVFIPSPWSRGGEDEGILLSVVLDARRASSFLLVLDAGGLGELARAFVPHHIPLGFHGRYLDRSALSR